ncbi:hypothetical protein H8959_007177 [Pygathrix nigripes]
MKNQEFVSDFMPQMAETPLRTERPVHAGLGKAGAARRQNPSPGDLSPTAAAPAAKEGLAREPSRQRPRLTRASRYRPSRVGGMDKWKAAGGVGGRTWRHRPNCAAAKARLGDFGPATSGHGGKPFGSRLSCNSRGCVSARSPPLREQSPGGCEAPAWVLRIPSRRGATARGCSRASAPPQPGPEPNKSRGRARGSRPNRNPEGADLGAGLGRGRGLGAGLTRRARAEPRDRPARSRPAPSLRALARWRRGKRCAGSKMERRRREGARGGVRACACACAPGRG